MSQLTYQSQQVDFSASQKAAFVDAERSLAMQKQAGLYDISKSIVEGVNKNMQVEFNNSMQAGLREAFNQNSADPDSFKEMADAQLDGLVKNAPMQLRQEMRDTFNQNAQKHYMRASVNLDKAQNENLKFETSKSLQQTNLDASQAVTDFLNPDINLAGFQAFGDAFQQFVTDLEATDSRGNSLFTSQQKLKAEDNFNGAVLSQFALEEMETIEDFEDKSNFIVDFISGKDFDLGEFKINSKNVSQQQRNAIQKRLKDTLKLQKEQEKTVLETKAMKSVADGKTFADSTSKDYLKSADSVYENTFDFHDMDMSDRTQREDAANGISKWVDTYKVIPETLKNQIGSMLNSSNFNQAALAANMVAKIDSNTFKATEFLDDKYLSFAFDLNNMVNSGVPAKDAYNDLKEIRKLSTQQKELMNELYENERRENPDNFSMKFLKDKKYYVWGADDPEDTQTLAAFSSQYNSLVKNEMMKGHSADSAHKTTKIIMAKVWQTSKINGSRTITAHAPEKFYSWTEIGITSDWMREQAVNLVQREVGDGFKKEDIFIIADNETYLNAGNSTAKPSYKVMIRDASGSPRPAYHKDDPTSELRIGADEWRGEEYIKIVMKEQGVQQEEVKEALNKWRRDKEKEIKSREYYRDEDKLTITGER